MALPTNITSGQGCNPVSSNCVIWQGPDIPCINLCHGDSISDVVAKLATELCDILNQLDIKTYDLTCFNPICPTPKNFHDLIQFLIGRICAIENCVFEPGCPPTCKECCPEDGSARMGGQDVPIADCFRYLNPIGDWVTTMTVADYAQAIGNRLCLLIGEVATIAAGLNNTNINVSNIDARVTVLENEPSCEILIPSSCLLGPPPPGGFPIQTVVQNLETQFCTLESVTGSPIEILLAIQKQCSNLDISPSLANLNTTMGTLPGWAVSSQYSTLADSINNQWIAICDMRAAVLNILKTCCCTDCDDVNINLTASLTGTNLTLYFTGSVPAGMVDCSPSGNQVTITDGAGNIFITNVSVITNLNGSFVVNLSGSPINVATNLIISIQGCWVRSSPGADCGGLQCERILTYSIINTVPCPQETIILTPTDTTIDYSFVNTVTGPVTYTVEIYGLDNVLISSQTTINPALAATVSGTFIALTPGTTYYILITVQVNSGSPVVCPQAFITTINTI